MKNITIIGRHITRRHAGNHFTQYFDHYTLVDAPPTRAEMSLLEANKRKRVEYTAKRYYVNAKNVKEAFENGSDWDKVFLREMQSELPDVFAEGLSRFMEVKI